MNFWIQTSMSGKIFLFSQLEFLFSQTIHAFTNTVTKPFFIGFWNLRVWLILLIMMLDRPSDRARRVASNDVNFARGTDRGSNIFAEYLICVLFPMVKNHFFINI